MTDISSTITQARQAGYTDDQILSEVQKQNPGIAAQTSKAASSGYHPTDILKEIANQNQAASTPTKSGGFLQGVGQFAEDTFRGLTKPVVSSLVKPFQAGESIAASVKGDLNPNLDVNLPFYGKISGNPTAKEALGTAASTIALGLGPVSGGAMLGAGDALQQNNGIPSIIGKTILGAAGGKVLDYVGTPIINSLAEKAAPAFGALTGALPQVVKDTGAALAQKIRTTELLPQGLKDGSEEALKYASKFPGVKQALNIGDKISDVPVETIRGLKNLISPNPQEALTIAIKPKNPEMFTKNVQDVLPFLKDTESVAGKPIENLNDLTDVIKQTKQRLWKSYEPIIQQHGDATIDGNNIADAMMGNIDRRFKTQNPQRAAAISALADTYRRPLPLSEAEDFLQSANAELETYYAKNKVGMDIAKGDPETAYIVNEAAALRKGLYEKLGDLSGTDAAKIKSTYGKLSQIQDEVTKRAAQVARTNIDGLAEKIGKARGAAKLIGGTVSLDPERALEGAGQLFATDYMKQRNDPNFLIKNSFEKAKPTGFANYTPVKVQRNLLPAAGESGGTFDAGTPINLGPQSQSTIDQAEMNRIQNQVMARKATQMPFDSSIPQLPAAGGSSAQFDANNPPIQLPQKSLSSFDQTEASNPKIKTKDGRNVLRRTGETGYANDKPDFKSQSIPKSLTSLKRDLIPRTIEVEHYSEHGLKSGTGGTFFSLKDKGSTEFGKNKISTIISPKNSFVTSDQETALTEIFGKEKANKILSETIDQDGTFDNFSKIDRMIAGELKKKGYDSIHYLSDRDLEGIDQISGEQWVALDKSIIGKRSLTDGRSKS